MSGVVAPAPGGEDGELEHEPAEGTMIVDESWPDWTPKQVGLFLAGVGGYAAMHAELFVAAGCAGSDLQQLNSEMMEGIGVLNGWHRYKILDAIKAMQAAAAEQRAARISEENEGIHWLDRYLLLPARVNPSLCTSSGTRTARSINRTSYTRHPGSLKISKRLPSRRTSRS